MPYLLCLETKLHKRIDTANLIDAYLYSITFRSVGKNYKNSTIIIGDSNTKQLKFSTGKHREILLHLDTTCRGKRLETFHISQIDESKGFGGIETLSFTVESMTFGIIPHVDKCRTPSKKK